MRMLTRRQQEVFDFITDHIKEEGFPPTIREIGRKLGIGSTNGVNDHLRALERKGYITRSEFKSRALKPVGMDSEMVDVPLVGDVAAGLPLLALEGSEDTVKVDRFFLKGNSDVFALRITGQSMIEDQIADGDFVFVKRTSKARPGDVVIAMIEGEATCKRYFPEEGRIRFQPANAAMSPIYVHQSEFRETMILGCVVGVYRRL